MTATDGNSGGDSQNVRRQQQQGQDSQNPDLYQWSGPGPRRQGQQQGQQGQQGGEHPVGKQADGSIVSETVPDQVVNNWHPDYSLSSDSAKQWFAQSQQQRNKPLQLDQNGDYVVQYGDDLSTIASRELQNTGKGVNAQSVRDETANLIALNDANFPSLDKNADLIKTGWKLHIENVQQQNPTNPGDQGQGQLGPGDHHRCVPKPHQGTDITPPGYQNKPSVYINNFYGNNNTVYEGTNGPGANNQAIPRNHQCYGNNNGGGRGRQQNGGQKGGQNGGDLYSYDGSGGRGRQQPGQQNNGGDLYSYDGSGGTGGRRQQQQNNGGDLYSYDGSGGTGGRQQQQNNGGDLYSYDGGGNQNNNSRRPFTYNDGQQSFSRDSNGLYHMQPRQPRPYSNGTGFDGTTFYPRDSQQQQQQRPTTIYINNFYGDNNTVYEGGGSPQNRIQQGHRCSQNGSDNYYNNGGGNGRGYRVQQIPNATAGDGQATQIPNYQGDAQYRFIVNNGNGQSDVPNQTANVRRQQVNTDTTDQTDQTTQQRQQIDNSGSDV